MSMKIRLARGGSKKRPHYSIVASDSRMPRDGRFLEKLGTYDPMLAKDNENRIKMDLDRIKDWLSKGAQPTDRVARFLEAAGVLPKTNTERSPNTSRSKNAGGAGAQNGLLRTRASAALKSRLVAGAIPTALYTPSMLSSCDACTKAAAKSAT